MNNNETNNQDINGGDIEVKEFKICQ